MSFKLGDLFPKKAINEPELDLDDPRWSELQGGYKGTDYDASIDLKKLETASSPKEISEIYHKLWNDLHHQGDVGLASYYAVPHLVRISVTKQLLDYNVFGLIAIIETRRHKDNPALPKLLASNYHKSIVDLAEFEKQSMSRDWDISMASSVLSVIALSKNQLKLATAIFEMDSEDRLDELLEMYY